MAAKLYRWPLHQISQMKAMKAIPKGSWEPVAYPTLPFTRPRLIRPASLRHVSINYLVGLALVLRLSPYSRVSTTCVLLTLLYARDVFLVAALLGAPFVLIEYVSIPLCLKMKAGSWAQFLMSPVTFSWVYVIGLLVIKESLSEINYSGVFSWLVRMSIFFMCGNLWEFVVIFTKLRCNEIEV
jgi:hypothetical protein